MCGLYAQHMQHTCNPNICLYIYSINLAAGPGPTSNATLFCLDLLCFSLVLPLFLKMLSFLRFYPTCFRQWEIDSQALRDNFQRYTSKDATLRG